MTIETEPKNAGRPTTYSSELAKEICDEIASTPKGLNKLCAENNHWPEVRSIYRWLKTNSEFCQQYARAKQLQIEALIDEIIEIADGSDNDYVVNCNGKLVLDHEHIQRSKLRIDTRKWLASKLVPKIYGDRVQTILDVDDSAIEAARELVKKYKAEKQLEN